MFIVIYVNILSFKHTQIHLFALNLPFLSSLLYQVSLKFDSKDQHKDSNNNNNINKIEEVCAHKVLCTYDCTIT